MLERENHRTYKISYINYAYGDGHNRPAPGGMMTDVKLQLVKQALDERDAWQARAEAAEKMAGQWLQLVTLRDNLIFELEAQLAAQAWRPMENVPDGEDVELLVHGYIGDDGLWYYRDGTTPLKGWRPID